MVGLRAWGNLNSVTQQPKTSQLRFSILVGIPGPAQFAGDHLGADLFTVAHRMRLGINFRRIAEHRGAETALNDAVVLDVKVRKENRERDRKEQEGDQRRAQNRIAREPEYELAALLPVSLRDLEFNGHELRASPLCETVRCAKRFAHPFSFGFPPVASEPQR